MGTGDPVGEAPEILETPDHLAFAEIEPVRVRAYPLTQQIAEKLHAHTRRYEGGQSSRERDFVDLLVIASEASMEGATLRKAIEATFNARSTHPIPKVLPAPPAGWWPAIRRLIEELRLGWGDLSEAAQAAGEFLDPVLDERIAGQWDPAQWAWK